MSIHYQIGQMQNKLPDYTEINTCSEIVLCTYNSSKYIKDCLESVLPQLCPFITLHIIDDCSQDNTFEIAASLVIQYTHFVSMTRNSDNKGLTRNLHDYLINTSKKYIFRMDADDISMPNRFKKQLDFLLNNGKIDILGGCALSIDECGSVKGYLHKPHPQKSIQRSLYKNPFIHSTVLFKKSAILRAGNYNINHRSGQDYELWFRCSRKNLVMVNMKQPLIYLRKSPRHKYSVQAYLREWKIGIAGSISCRIFDPRAYLLICLRLLICITVVLCYRFFSRSNLVRSA
jgi:glycosyltransferase involved in cell wall biosynthesis